MPHHAKATMWTVEHSRRWFTNCDQCGQWHIVADYYEVYPPPGSKGDATSWWWACSRCLLHITSDRIDELLQKREDVIKEREKLRLKLEAAHLQMYGL